MQVRTAAGEAFSVLFKGGAGSIIDSMLPSLFEGLAIPERAHQSIEGLRVILSVRPSLLSGALPKLLALPIKLHNASAVGPLCTQAGGHLKQHLALILPRLLALPVAQVRLLLQ